MSLQDRTVLVTGASSGIGATTAVRLAAHGTRVGLVGRDRARLDATAARVREAGGTPVVLPADLTSTQAAGEVVERLVAETGGLDVLVNGAGLPSLGAFGGSEAGAWRDVVAVNLGAVLDVTRAALDHLLAAAADGPRGCADVVTISSASGRRVSARSNVYAATKHAVGAFSESLRLEVTERAVRVALVEPGFVDTPMIDQAPDHAMLQPDDVADAVEWIVTRPAHAAVSEVMLRPTSQVF